MDNLEHPNCSAFGEYHQLNAIGETCESAYQSVGYDSGICLSNYRSSDWGSVLLLSTRDSDGLDDSVRSRQPGDEDGPPVEASNCNQFSSSGGFGPVQSDPVGAVGEIKDTQQDCCCVEDQFYQQDEEGDTLLHLAIIKPNIGFAVRMIEMTRISEYLDIQNKTYMHSPLHLAVIVSQPPVVRALLISGASTTLRDRNGNTALHLACKQGDVECVKQLSTPFSEMENRYLWSRGVPPCVVRPMQSSDANLLNYEGESGLHLALFSAAKSGSEIFDFLVSQCSADINTKDGKCGYTVLHQAVKLKDAEMVQFLLRYPQLAVNELCYSGNTALDIAISLNLPQLEMVLRMAGGICTQTSDSPDISDNNQIDEFDDLMIGGLRLNP